MGVYLRRYHQDKPPIGSTVNWGHPLAQGLVGCWLMNEGCGNRVLDISNYRNNGIATTGTGGWKNTLKGKAYRFDGTNTVINCGSANILDNITPFSIEFMVYRTNNNSNFIQKASGYGSSGWSVSVLSSNAFNFNVAGGTNLSYSTGFSLAASTWYHLAVSWNGIIGSSADVNLYINRTEGAYTLADNGSGNRSTDAAQNLNIGGVSYRFAGDIAYVRLWRRMLMPAEISSLYEAPYQFIQTPRRIFYSLPAGAVSVPNPRRSMTGVNRIKGIKAVTF